MGYDGRADLIRAREAAPMRTNGSVEGPSPGGATCVTPIAGAFR
jgi:hypothetical protein